MEKYYIFRIFRIYLTENDRERAFFQTLFPWKWYENPEKWLEKCMENNMKIWKMTGKLFFLSFSPSIFHTFSMHFPCHVKNTKILEMSWKYGKWQENVWNIYSMLFPQHFLYVFHTFSERAAHFSCHFPAFLYLFPCISHAFSIHFQVIFMEKGSGIVLFPCHFPVIFRAEKSENAENIP